MSALLSAQQLSIGYGKKVVGERIGMDLHVGEILALLGPNGSGKSTLFKTLLGLLPALTGQVLLQGQPLSQHTRRAIAQQVGYVPQAQEGQFAFSVLDMVLMGRAAHMELFAQPKASDRHLAEQILTQLGIAHLAHCNYPYITGGERQLTLIARALLQQPKMLVLDEPTASLDFANQILVLEQIQRLRVQGLSVLLCTHQPEHALQVADRLALFKNGRIEKIGTVADLGSAENLAWLYNVSVEHVYAQLKRDLVK